MSNQVCPALLHWQRYDERNYDVKCCVTKPTTRRINVLWKEAEIDDNDVGFKHSLGYFSVSFNCMSCIYSCATFGSLHFFLLVSLTDWTECRPNSHRLESFISNTERLQRLLKSLMLLTNNVFNFRAALLNQSARLDCPLCLLILLDACHLLPVNIGGFGFKAARILPVPFARAVAAVTS